MKTTLKIVLTLGVLVVLVLAGGVAYILTTDPNNHKDWIAERFRQQTGRELSLAGDLSISVYPWLGFAVNDVAVANAPHAGPAPMLTAEHAAFRIRLLPLLRRQYEIDTVTLRGAHLALNVDAEGNNNWSDLTGEPDSAGSVEDEEGRSASELLANLRLGGVDIRDVSVVYEDQANNQHVEIADLVLQTEELVYGEPIPVDMSMALSSSAPSLSADVSASGVVNYDLDNGRYEISPLALTAIMRGDTVPDGSAELTLDTAMTLEQSTDTLTIPELSLTLPETELQARVSARNVTSDNPAFDSEVSLEGSDLALLLKIAAIEPLASQIAQLPDRGFRLQASLGAETANAAVTVPTFEASLLGASFDGEFMASNLDTATPVIQGHINAGGPNLPSVLEVLGVISGGNDSRLAEGGRGLQQIAEEDKVFAINTDFDANLQAGSIDLPVLAIELLGATIDGSLTAEGIDSGAPILSGHLQARGSNLPQLMQIAGWFQGGEESPVFQYGGQLTEVADRSFALDTEFDVNLERGDVRLPRLSASALGFALSGNLSASDMRNAGGVAEGQLSLTGDNLPEVLNAIGQNEFAEVLEQLQVDIELAGSRNDLTIDPLRMEVLVSGARAGGEPVWVTLDAGSRLNMDQETLALDDLSLSGLGLDVAGTVSVSRLLSEPEISGRLGIESFSPRRLAQQLNVALPETADSTVLQNLSLQSEFSLASGQVAVSGLQMQLDDSSFTGEASLQSGQDGEPIIAAFDLEITELDVDRYLPPTAPQAATDDPEQTAMVIPVDLLRGLDLTGALTVQKLGLSGLALANVELGVRGQNDRLDLSPLATALYGGRFDGSAVLDAAATPPNLTLEANLQQIDLEPLLLDVLDASYLSGHGNIELSLASRGADTLAMQHNLSGDGRIALEDGVLRGVDVASVLRQLETMIRNRRPGDIQRGEQTPFETFAATLAINEGVITSNDLLIRSPGFQIEGRGTLLDLTTQSIDYNLVTSVDASTATNDTQEYDLGGYSLPIACTGSLDSPRCLPDANEIIRNLITNEIRGRVGDLLRRAAGADEPAQDTDVDSDSPESQDQTQDIINRALDQLIPN